MSPLTVRLDVAGQTVAVARRGAMWCMDATLLGRVDGEKVYGLALRDVGSRRTLALSAGGAPDRPGDPAEGLVLADAGGGLRGNGLVLHSRQPCRLLSNRVLSRRTGGAGREHGACAPESRAWSDLRDAGWIRTRQKDPRRRAARRRQRRQINVNGTALRWLRVALVIGVGWSLASCSNDGKGQMPVSQAVLSGVELQSELCNLSSTAHHGELKGAQVGGIAISEETLFRFSTEMLFSGSSRRVITIPKPTGGSLTSKLSVDWDVEDGKWTTSVRWPVRMVTDRAVGILDSEWPVQVEFLGVQCGSAVWALASAFENAIVREAPDSKGIVLTPRDRAAGKWPPGSVNPWASMHIVGTREGSSLDLEIDITYEENNEAETGSYRCRVEPD